MTVLEPNAPTGDSGAALDVWLDDAPGTAAGGQQALPAFPTQPQPAQADPSARAEDASPGYDQDAPETLTALLDRDVDEAGLDGEPVPPLQPLPQPYLLPYRSASGRYRSTGLGFQLELRVDVDGRRPLRRLSGDYFQVSGGTTTYFGSWTVDAVRITRTKTTITVIGTARTTWSTTFTVAKVTIPRIRLVQRPPAATITWYTTSGARGGTYVCPWQAGAFRVVELEQDCESGVTPFVSYDTSSLPSGGPARLLTVAGAYGEAGIQMLDTGAANVINTPANHVWTNASLHHAMETHFSRWQERPQFKVWLLHAMRHEIGVGLRGIMFDQQGLQRQGCASFYQAISAPTAANSREQLYVHVHELGHCFNLFHSFHKTFMTPPLPNRPGALSWMNYPGLYNPGGGAPSGPAAFWAAFPFQFDDLELAHVRHGFRNAVIMGGNPFGTGAAMEVGEEYADPISDTSGLQLAIAAPDATPLLGTPVVVEIRLHADRGREMHEREQLHPKYGFVTVAVNRPRGDVVVHRPPVEHCAEPRIVRAASEEEEPVSAYIGYDAHVGQIFEDPGTYRIRASYTAPDGTVLVSNLCKVRVVPPREREDEQVAELMLGDDVGMVLTLLGTDSPHLADGTAALQTMLAEHAAHPTAVFARLAEGINAARPFTEVSPDGTVHVRPRDLERADALLNEAVDASRGDEGLDDLTVYQAMSYLAQSHEAEGDSSTAHALREDAISLASAKGEPPSVIESLRQS